VSRGGSSGGIGRDGRGGRGGGKGGGRGKNIILIHTIVHMVTGGEDDVQHIEEDGSR
jgi:hypothetical protein